MARLILTLPLVAHLVRTTAVSLNALCFQLNNSPHRLQVWQKLQPQFTNLTDDMTVHQRTKDVKNDFHQKRKRCLLYTLCGYLLSSFFFKSCKAGDKCSESSLEKLGSDRAATNRAESENHYLRANGHWKISQSHRDTLIQCRHLLQAMAHFQ